MENFETDENKSNLCRICLGLGEYDIYSDAIVVDDKNIQIDAILKEFTSLDLENLKLDSSNIPTLICASCADKLIQCYQFIQQIHQADDYIMKLITMSPNAIDNHDNDNDNITIIESEIDEKPDIEEYTVHIVDDFDDDEVIEKKPDIPNIQNIPKLLRKRKTNNKKKSLLLNENISENYYNNDDDNNDIDKNIINKKLKISNIHNSSIEDVAFVITKFIPSETITTTNINNDNIENVNQQTEQSIINQYNNDDIIKSQNIIRTYDLAAVEIDPTNKQQFEKLMEKNFDDDDDNDDNENSDSSSSAVYACQYCTRAFSSSRFLKQHIRKTHVCQFCMKGFEKNVQLYEHIRNSHSQFNCPFCQKSYKSNSNLRQHMKKIHTCKLPAHTSLLAFNKNDENSLWSNQNNTAVV